MTLGALATDREVRAKADHLTESEAIYRAVVDSQVELICRWLPDGTLTFVNEAYARYFRRPKEALLGHSFLELLPPDEIERMRAFIASFSPERPWQELEHRVLAPDGELRWQHWTNLAVFNDAGQLIEFQSVGRDVTERRQAEIARAQTLGVLRAVLDSSTDGIVALDDAGRVIIYNQRLVDMWNLPAGWDTEMSRIERQFVFAQRMADPALVLRRLEEILQQPGTESYDVMRAADGRTVAISSSPYRSGKMIVGRVWNFRDISEYQRQEAINLQAQKLEAIGQLAGGIAHDFNNALTIILGNVTLARDEVGDNPAALERLAAAESACLRARALTQQLLTFSAGGAPIKRSLSLAPLLRDITAFTMHGAGILCESEFPPDLWPVDADEGQIRQMMINLLVNAQEAMPQGGKVELRAENVQSTNGQPGRWVRITLRDHGIGIPPEHLPRVFDPYFSTKPQGRGLGLPAVYSIVRDHGGQVRIESQVGQGTTITVQLPASIRPTLAPAETRKMPAGRTLYILVMDDEEEVRSVAGRMLKRAGHEVAYAVDGTAALALYEKARQDGRPFDLTIMDLTIPGGMGGKEAVKKLKELDPNARVIVSSGYSTDPIMANYRQYGFCSVVAKPYQRDELLRAIAECMD